MRKSAADTAADAISKFYFINVATSGHALLRHAARPSVRLDRKKKNRARLRSLKFYLLKRHRAACTLLVTVLIAEPAHVLGEAERACFGEEEEAAIAAAKGLRSGANI